ncbi:MAG: rhodanese-like domain-containing protein [Verrucomicrobiota bacterium]
MKRTGWLMSMLMAFVAGAAPMAGTLSESEARTQLKNGALLIDVRTTAEFASKHLTNAINLPLDRFKTALPVRVPDKGRVLLLHCRSGNRSRTAMAEARSLGYTNVFNVGSYESAEKITTGPR